MVDTATHVVDRVFPIVPVRQWVLSLPFALRYRMAYDRSLTSDVLNVFIRALFGDLRRRAEQLLSLRSSQCGAVTFVQRFGDALNANVHFHSMVIDGVYAPGANGRPRFHQLPAPEDQEVLHLTALVNQRVRSLLVRRGLGTAAEPQQADPLAQDDPGIAALLASSVGSRIAVGSNAATASYAWEIRSIQMVSLPSRAPARPWSRASACTPKSVWRPATECAWKG